MQAAHHILLLTAILSASATLATSLAGQSKAIDGDTAAGIHIELHRAEKLASKLGSMRHGTAVEREEGETDEAVAARLSIQTLGAAARFASRFIQPALRVGEEIKPLGGRTLVAIGRRAQHRWLDQFIKTNSDLESHLMHVTCQFLSMEAKSYDRHVKPLLEKAGGLRANVVLAKGDKTDKYISNLKKLRGCAMVNAPTLTMLPAQRSHLTICGRTSYVKDFDPVFDASGKLTSIAPVLDVIQDGTSLDMICAMVRPGIVGISLRAMWCKLETPMKQVEVHVKECSSSIKLQIPKMRVAEVDANVELPVGATVMFELPKTSRPHMLVLVTVRLIKV